MRRLADIVRLGTDELDLKLRPFKSKKKTKKLTENLNMELPRTNPLSEQRGDWITNQRLLPLGHTASEKLIFNLLFKHRMPIYGGFCDLEVTGLNYILP